MAFLKPEFSAETIQAIKAHALEAYPMESCGMILDGTYVPCANMAADPNNEFKIDPAIIATAGETLQAIVHSHPNGDPSPSAADMESQMDMNCIFGIVPCNEIEVTAEISWWGDFRLEQSLIGQTFLHGINDCYTVVRGYYWQTKGIKLPEIPRDVSWWEQGDNIYVENFIRCGFRVIQQNEVLQGDCFIGKVRSPVSNHGGVVLDRGIALHHLSNRLSRREPIARWAKYVTHWLRYEGQNG